MMKLYINKNNFIVNATPMTKWEFAKNYPKYKHNMVNGVVDNITGFLCNWNGYKFWVEEDWLINNYKECDINE